jgi:hypothetical protein
METNLVADGTIRPVLQHESGAGVDDVKHRDHALDVKSSSSRSLEYEALHAGVDRPFSEGETVAALAHSATDRLTTRPLEAVGVDTTAESPLDSENGSIVQTLLAQAAPQVVQ